MSETMIQALVRQMRAEHPSANPFDVADWLAPQFAAWTSASTERFVQLWIKAQVRGAR